MWDWEWRPSGTGLQKEVLASQSTLTAFLCLSLSFFLFFMTPIHATASTECVSITLQGNAMADTPFIRLLPFISPRFSDYIYSAWLCRTPPLIFRLTHDRGPTSITKSVKICSASKKNVTREKSWLNMCKLNVQINQMRLFSFTNPFSDRKLGRYFVVWTVTLTWNLFLAKLKPDSGGGRTLAPVRHKNQICFDCPRRRSTRHQTQCATRRHHWRCGTIM